MINIVLMNMMKKSLSVLFYKVLYINVINCFNAVSIMLIIFINSLLLLIYPGIVLMGLLIFTTFLVGILLSSDIRNLKVLSNGGSNLPFLFLFGFLLRGFNLVPERDLLLLLARLKSLSSPRSSLIQIVMKKNSSNRKLCKKLKILLWEL